jgi:hypothetical protein
MKERIGDALRNAAMRFGAALDLWHKGDLHKDQNEEDEPQAVKGLAPRDLQRHHHAIKSAQDIDALKTAYTAGYKAAHAVNDKVAEEVLLEAKDARKLELEGMPA